MPEDKGPPELLDGFGGWFEDFWELSTERAIGMGIGEIPAHAIDAHVAGWRYDDAEMFRTCIRAMDRVYLEAANNDGNALPAQGVSPQESFRSAFSGRRGK